MFKKLFKIKNFSIVFVLLLLMDVIIKLSLDSIWLRFFTKSYVMLSLIGFYYYNNKEINLTKKLLTYSAMALFLLGDICFLFYLNETMFLFGMILFVIAKFLYSLRFSNNRDFNLISLLPFILLASLLMIFILNTVIKNLGSFYWLSLVYFYSCLILALMAFLRKGAVNSSSMLLVWIGVVFFLIMDAISALSEFYMPNFAFSEISTPLFYGLAQYFIIMGLIREHNPNILKMA